MKKHSLDILIIINIILALFLFFGDKFITTVDWEIFGSIATVISAIAMIVTAVIMYQGNKISAKSSTDSIHEMREQYKQQKKDIQDREDKQEKDTQYREDKKELREYIEKYMLPEVENLKNNNKNIGSEISEQDIVNFNLYYFSSLTSLAAHSLGLFYQDKITKILGKIIICFPITHYSKEYSNKVKELCLLLLNNISTTLYKALIDEKIFLILISQIDLQIKKIVENLTDEEKEKIKQFNEQEIRTTK